MTRTRLFPTAVLATALLSVAACGGDSDTGTESTPKASSASSPASSSASGSAAAGAAEIKVASTSKGSVLTDDQGRVLYMFTPDKQGDSVCYDECATAWPPTLTTGDPKARDGADASLLGTTTRKDGSTQVTYNKYPLYTFAFDAKPGDVNGQAVKSIWWVLNAAGEPQEDPAKVAVGDTSLGKVLTDVRGETVYMFTSDKNGTSVCTGDCLKSWPPLLTTGDPTAGTGAQASLLGTTKRDDGSTQVTYNKLPLYFFAADQAPGTSRARRSRTSGTSSTARVRPSRRRSSGTADAASWLVSDSGGFLFPEGRRPSRASARAAVRPLRSACRPTSTGLDTRSGTR